MNWGKAHPLDAVFLAALCGVIIYFYGFFQSFSGGNQSALQWLWSAWNPETDYNHGKLLPFILLYLVWHERENLWSAPKASSNWGIPFLALGLALYLLSVRMVQPRIAIGALPFIVIGCILLLWGKATAKRLAFVTFFIWLVIPIPSLQQATAWLQGFIASSVELIVGIFGVHVQAVGVDLISMGPDQFRFEVAGGCSGVRSLMAMSMLAALYVYFTQDRLWKQLLIFAFTLVFTLIGNVARVASIVLIAKMGFREFASGFYHDYSVFIIFFPVALASMVGFAKLLNMDYPKLISKMKRKRATAG